MSETPIAVDLFCGAGGASCGIDDAGFEIVAAVDQNADALNTHADNLPGYTVSHDLSDVDPSVLPDRAQSPDYLHGSPPCKGFSTANEDRDIDDPRNSLVFDFVDWAAALEPAVVTMENVTGMTNIGTGFMGRVKNAFRDAGYGVSWRTLNAADYGVPQTRKRVITVGVRADLDAPDRWFPRPTHAETATTTLDGRELREWVTVQEAIGDLAGEVREHRPQGDNNATSHAVWRGGASPAHTLKGQGSHALRGDGGFALTDQINEAHQKAGRRPMGTSDEPANTIRAGTPPLKIPPQHDDPIPTITADEGAAVAPIRPPNHEHNTTERERRRAGKGGKFDPELLDWNNPSITIRAGGGDDGRGQNKPCVEDGEVRRLTVRECARIQSFPDWFVFRGSKTSQYAQVGNAVPPLLQSHIAAHLREVVL